MVLNWYDPVSSPSHGAQIPRAVIPGKLRELADLFHPDYPTMRLVLIGLVDGQEVMRLPCPVLVVPLPDPEADTNAARILQALDEAERPLTVVDLGHRANGGDPSGAMRAALRKLVKSGHVRELPGPPRQYERL